MGPAVRCLLLLKFLGVLVSVESLSITMGLLKVGKPKSWDNSKKDLMYIRQAGVKQFISTYKRVKDLKGDELLFGDEIEYGVFKLDSEQRTVRLSLRAKEIMDELNRKESLSPDSAEGCHWVPEYGAWMVEATPDRPYTGYTNDLLRIERNMRLRRKRMLTVLADDEACPTISTPFLLGSQGSDGTFPATALGGINTESEYIGDDIINPHPRFGTLTAHIRQRRGTKVNIRVPLFRDEQTPEFAGFPGTVTAAGSDGCCGGDSLQLWRYGKGDISMEKHGRNFVSVGCSKSSTDEEFDDGVLDQGVSLHKWLVDVKCPGCLGLFYRRAPGEIVPDADWPRNGEVVVGHQMQDLPGWIRLQNGYYLPMHSDDGKIAFLRKVSARVQPSNSEMKRVGSNTPLFHGDSPDGILEDVVSMINGDESEHAPALDNGDVSSSSNGKPSEAESLRPCIHMDAMAFGMGCTCLQVTFQAKDVDESRYMYDQLAVMAPIMMALTASTPILKGRLADTDARWGVISESVDCRTPGERGREDPDVPYQYYTAKGTRRIYKSRYDSISTYIYQGVVPVEEGNSVGLTNRVLNIYNDIPVPIDGDSYRMLREKGIDPALAQHVAHLFIRDPLVVFEGAVEELDDEVQTEHWESLQSTNWQTVRWKPPPPRNSPNDPHIGWRTEFRSMEMQLTDFENSAFTVFIVLLTRVILAFDLNLYLPISKVDANMQRAHSRNAAAKGKFFFRRHMAPLEEGDAGYNVEYVSMFVRAANGDDQLQRVPSKSSIDGGVDANGVSNRRKNAPCGPGGFEENSYEEMTMEEIMCGKGTYFPGLIPLVYAYLDHIGCDSLTRGRVNEYLEFIEARAKEIAYDLTIACRDIGLGKLHVPELLGEVKIDPVVPDEAYQTKLDSARIQNDRLLDLLQRYTSRRSFSAADRGDESELEMPVNGQSKQTDLQNI